MKTKILLTVNSHDGVCLHARASDEGGVPVERGNGYASQQKCTIITT